MTPQALIDLQDRCKQAKTFGRQIANAAAFVAELEAQVGVVVLERGVLKNSPGHLLALIEKAGRGEAVAETTTEVTPKATKKKVSTKAKPKAKKAKKPAPKKLKKPERSDK
jgi:hypothetical protein